MGLMIRNGEIRCHENDRYSGDLARKYDGVYLAWAFVELISFGGFIDFYRFYSLRWDDREMRNSPLGHRRHGQLLLFSQHHATRPRISPRHVNLLTAL